MRKTAGRLGQMVGLSAEEVNLKLAELGYLQGMPRAWTLTDEGKKHGEMCYKDNGYGGSAARSWSYAIWDEEIVELLGDPVAYLDKINNNRKRAGLPPITSWN